MLTFQNVCLWIGASAAHEDGQRENNTEVDPQILLGIAEGKKNKKKYNQDTLVRDKMTHKQGENNTEVNPQVLLGIAEALTHISTQRKKRKKKKENNTEADL